MVTSGLCAKSSHRIKRTLLPDQSSVDGAIQRASHRFRYGQCTWNRSDNNRIEREGEGRKKEESTKHGTFHTLQCCDNNYFYLKMPHPKKTHTLTHQWA